jgi:hypothetical protein
MDDYSLDTGDEEDHSDPQERCHVTVCIAALCKWDGLLNLNGPIVVGASDRMLTSDDIEFQPPRTKVFLITNSIYALTAGNSSMQTELCNRTFKEVGRRIAVTPDKWFKVEDAAEIFSREVITHRRAQISKIVLEPLGLDWNTFVSRQKEMSPDWLSDITDQILKYKLGISTIISGLDEDGAHIYVVNGMGIISCDNSVGFAAIGVGKRHAESEFMFAGHTPYAGFAETMLRTYGAKKRAEVAPGVGKATDMFVIGSLGAATLIPEEAKILRIDQIYEALEISKGSATVQANADCAKYIEDELKAAIGQQQQQQPPPPTQS